MPTSSASRGSGLSPPDLFVEGLSAGYGGNPVVSDISLRCEHGTVVCVLGPNGAGKSTLLKALTGHVPVMQGRVLLQGEDITNIRADRLVRKGIGYVPQAQDVFDTLTVSENLEMGGYLLSRKSVVERIEQVISIFPNLGRLRGTSVSKLSGGERKMVAIGRVLMLQPKLLILDEPTSNLAPQLVRFVLEQHVRRLAAADMTVLLVEQKAEEALKVSDWAYILVDGAVQVEGRPDTLLARHEFGEIFLGLLSGNGSERVAGQSGGGALG